ncbi:MAG: CHAT domain-containing protein [Vicinamibacteria bacterium]|nr:CHAT domain-containing protein [Vicinamibacteria bacterium]
MIERAAILLFVLLNGSLPARASSASEADDLYKRATAFVEQNRLKDAIPLLEQAATIDAAQGAGRHESLARDWISIGLCLNGLGQKDKAVARLRQAVEIFAALDAPAEQVGILQSLGLLEFSRSRYQEAKARFEKALALARTRDVQDPIPSLLNNLGLVDQAWGRFGEAIGRYRLAHEEYARRGDALNSAMCAGNIANVYLMWGHYPEAEASYKETLSIFKRLGDDMAAIHSAINLGITYNSWGRYDQGRAHLEDALAEARRRGWGLNEAWALANLGKAYYAAGHFDKAESSYSKALRTFREADDLRNVAATTGDLGMVYDAWGRHDLALRSFEQLLDIAEKIESPIQILDALRLIGTLHLKERRFEAGIADLRRGLELADRLDMRGVKPTLLNSIGAAFFLWRKYDEAEKAYHEALAISERLGKKDETARILIHLGGISQVKGDHKNARKLYLRGLALTRSAGTKADEVTALNNLGALALSCGDYRKAERRFLDAIDVKEQLRLTATGKDRRDFLAAWISSYRWLVLLYFLDDRPAALFNASERIKARLLAEQIGARTAANDNAFRGIDAVRKKLGDKTAIVSFANVDWKHPLADREFPIAVLATRETLHVYTFDVQDFVRRVHLELGEVVEETHPDVRGFKITRNETEKGLSDVLMAYSRLLSEPASSARQHDARERLARELYRLLLGPADEALAAKEELIVIPDGSLGTIPFETLRLPDGRRLVERHHVTYVPSLGVKQLLEQRRYGLRPRPLLAMGGPSLTRRAEPRVVEVSTRQLDALRSEARRHIETNASAREAYTALGLDSWSDLPGTRAEVESIGRIVPDSDVLTGTDVSERKIKDLSRQGVLRSHRVLHFATHALLIPDAPELSALVFSEAQDGQGEEDGYLNAKEITELDIAADFVNLSACETGLGTIYGGEGVVGLTHAFLEAGANGMSVSFWQVADASTKELMVGLYQLVQERGLSHARALTEVKRAFLHGGQYQDPFFWAPFVYYGN